MEVHHALQNLESLCIVVLGIFILYNVQCLRNRKHVPFLYRVIEKKVEVLENEKCFHSFFEFLLTLIIKM